MMTRQVPMATRFKWASEDVGIKTALILAIACSSVLLVLGVVFASLGRSGGVLLLILGSVSLGTMLFVGLDRTS
jgi:hypothetical protein